VTGVEEMSSCFADDDVHNPRQNNTDLSVVIISVMPDWLIDWLLYYKNSVQKARNDRYQPPYSKKRQ
jgi:hypothetical protein